MEALAAGRWLPRRLLIVPELAETDPAIHAEQLGIPCEIRPAREIQNFCGRTDHQGLAAQMPEYPYAAMGDISAAQMKPSLWLILDRIQDPFNFGAILRAAEVLGASAVLIGSSGQCDVTPHVARSSAGAVHHLPIVRCRDLLSGCEQLREEHGIRIIGATGDAGTAVDKASLTGAVGLLIGNEGAGLSASLLALCDETVRIPQQGRIASLNAAVAAGILMYEANRQRSQG